MSTQKLTEAEILDRVILKDKRSEKIDNWTPVFVEQIPANEHVEVGKLYISEKLGASLHLCACGCGLPVRIPIGGTCGWKLHRNGNKISITPSLLHRLGCKSHYFITDNKTDWR